MRASIPVALALLLAPVPSRADDELAEGQPAPSFTLHTMNQEASGVALVSLDRYVGAEPEDPDARALIISFFASWCGPCKREMPYLQQLHLMYRERGLRVVAVDIDQEEKGIAEARKMIAQARVTYPVLLDRFNFLARRYLGEQSPLPSLFIVNRDGSIARIEKGYGKDASTFLLADVQRALGLDRNRKARAAAPRPAAAR